MAVLQKQGHHAHIIHILTKLDGKLCPFFYVVGFASFLALAYHGLNYPTYFSENALLPGLVDSEFYHDFGAEGYYKDLKQLLIKREDTDDMFKIPSEWLTDMFRNLAIDTYVQKYSYKYPFGVLEDRNLTGQNVYGILRAPRSSGTEALVLSVPFRPEHSGQEATFPGIAIMLSLAKAFRRHSYWAKDVIFLVTDNEEIGIQAWLSSYHHTPNKYIEAGVLPSRSGSVQAAINLELSSSAIGRVNVKFEGLNGKLPNLDLINTVEKLFHREGLKIIIQNKSREQGINEWARYVYSLKTMLTMVWHQAPGNPTGNHGYFHKYNIEAVTIQGTRGKTKKAFGFADTGRVIEGIFRSLNNLLERFHQSFFFYLLPSPNRYISIGVYMGPLGVMVLPVVIKALSLWVTLSGETNEKNEDTKSEKEDKDQQSEIKEGDDASQGLSTTQESKNKEPLDKLTHVAVFLICFLTGVGSFYSADYFVKSSYKFGLGQEEGLAIGFIVIHLLVVMQPFIYKWRMMKSTNGLFKLNRNVLDCFALLVFGISLGAISVMNVSMAFLVAATWVPVVLINRVTKYRFLSLVKYLIILCASPLSMLFIGCLIKQELAGKRSDLISSLRKAWIDLQDGLMLSAFQFYLSDNWTFPLLNFVFLPIWSMFWFVATVNN